MTKYEEKIFAGIGSRKVPEVFQPFMSAITFYLVYYCGFNLRSGRAPRSDDYFERGLPKGLEHRSEIYLPREGFGGKGKGVGILTTNMMSKLDAIHIISTNQLHEDWDNLMNSKGDSFAVAAHIRNVFQILGDLTDGEKPVKFVVCWTPDGAKTHLKTTDATGGTRTAINLASRRGIPVFNLANRDDLYRMYKRVSSVKIPFQLPPLPELERYCSRRQTQV
ncbi:hypothetical protein [Vibrio crassostreae]|uniref:hypothetical protein n=1 Tax=Vibrio crassostreae TaxID=246167 RepID=UPI001B31369A|nr:hypothetical protein [Vibrio crassostreae]